MTGTRAAILDCLGSFPERGDPAPEVTDAAPADGHRRLTVEYAVEPGERIRAYLLLPEGIDERAPAPGILAIHQHAGQFFLGKSEPAGLSATAEYHYGAELARRGYVVLCPDLLAFEGRRPPEYRREEGTAPDGADYERFVAMDRLMAGSTLQAKYLSDLAAGLDYLARRDEVDADRLGAIGHSLGGQEAAWLAWYDDRVAAAVASCGVSTYETIRRDGVTHNFAFYAPGLLDVGDLDAVVGGAAPTALLLTNGADDPIFPVDGVRDLASRAGDAYDDAGHPDRFESVVFEGGHGFPDDVRERAYAWLDRWL